MLTGATSFTSMAATGVGVIRGRLRKTPPNQLPEQLFCNSSRPISALASSSSLTVENDLVMEAGEPVPRLVFGGVPSFEETKEATADLKEVLDTMYLSSPKSFESQSSLLSGISLPLNTEIVDNRSGVIIENNTNNPGTQHVHEAFRLLRCNTAIQDIVASIASDQKVYEAVLENSEVKKFIHAYEISSDTFEDEEHEIQKGESKASTMEKLKDLKDFIIKMVTNIPSHLPGLFGSSSSVESASGSDDKDNTSTKAGKFGSGFVEKLRNLKNSVVEMVSNIPNYLPNLYDSSSADQKFCGSDRKGNTQSSPSELGVGTTLTSLAIMVIMVVVFKRI